MGVVLIHVDAGGRVRWSRSCAEFARSSTRGARTSRSCAGWARERRGRRRWLRTGEGGASVRPCEKTSSVFAPVQRCPSREARGKRSESGSRATHLRPRDWTSRRSCPSRATRRWCRARRRRPRGSRVDGRGEKWAPPGLRGETWRVKFSRDWVRRELQRGCASAREMRDEQDAWHRRRATVCDWSISRNSPGINFSRLFATRHPHRRGFELLTPCSLHSTRAAPRPWRRRRSSSRLGRARSTPVSGLSSRGASSTPSA